MNPFRRVSFFPDRRFASILASAVIARPAFLLLLAALLPLAACQNSSSAEQKQAASPPPPAPAVKIARPIVKEVREWDDFTGRIEAVDRVELKARVSGYLEKVNFKAGEKVKKGELLFVIDPRPFKAQLAFAEAELEKARARRQLAVSDWQRAVDLFNVKAISREEYDARRKGLSEISAEVKSAAANVEAARLNVDFTKITAPISGRIGRELLTVGNLVKSDDTLLATVTSTDPMYVYVDADEQALLKYRRHAARIKSKTGLRGVAVQLGLADEKDFPHAGTLDYVEPQEHSPTGTIALRGVFANPDELLSPGFFARLRLSAGPPYTAVLLPNRAIGSDQAQKFVWVVTPERQIAYRGVELGAPIGNSRVIEKGIDPNDWIVIEGAQKLKAGMKVAPEKITLDSPPSADFL